MSAVKNDTLSGSVKHTVNDATTAPDRSRACTDDLATLPELSDAIILQELQTRYQKDIIYTYIGDIVVAINPYKDLNLYTPEVLQQYTNVSERSSLPPHIFTASDSAFASMWRDDVNQCCVVSGESGAGKTESTKLLVRHIVHLCRQQTGNLHERIVEVNPLLEAFGNARTVMNNNSSRFGKFIELQFDHGGHLQGATITEYLLEKSRVVQQNAGERNFHIFYYLFAGLEATKREINLLKDPAEHRIMCPVDGTEVFVDKSAVEHCKTMWNQVLKIMELVGFNSEQREAILAMLTAVVHITDIKFLHDPDTDGAYIENEEILEITSLLLGVKPEDLGGALIANVTTLRGEEIVSLKNMHQASDSRDALAKALYGRLFGWIVRQINKLLNPKQQTAMTSIAILDIYGFENFQQNSFEQLCINAANEQLQLFFNKHVFRSELDAYAKEGVKGASFKYADNEPIIKMLFDSVGLYAIFDEESKFPQGNDLTLIEKMTKTFAKNSAFQKPKGHTLHFVIQHYAGAVTYNVSGFLEKNRDTLSANLLDVMKASQSSFVSDLFKAVIRDTGAFITASGGSRGRRRGNIPSVILDKPLDFGNKAKESKTKKLQEQWRDKKSVKNPLPEANPVLTKTLSSYFKNSLKELIEKMSVAEPHFIRCIKPNSSKASDSFDSELVMRQLRYTGVLETINIRRQGYAVRLPFDLFIQRYKFIGFPQLSNVESGPNNCKRILTVAGVNGYEMGKTKVFLRYYHAEQLGAAFRKIVDRVVTCQAYLRGFMARLAWRRMGQAMAATQKECSALGELISSVSEATVSALKNQDNEDLLQASRNKLKRLPKPPPADYRNSRHPQDSLELLLEGTISRLPVLGPEIWCKVHYFEKGRVAAKFYSSEWNLLVNNGNTKYDGRVIGLAHDDIGHDSEDEDVASVYNQIGEGIKIDRDSHGNIYATRLTSCEVIVKGFKDPESNCIADEVIQSSGKLGPAKTKVYDIIKFMAHAASELRKPTIDIRRMEMLSMISFSFVLDTDNCYKTPCWLNVINLFALELLGKDNALADIVRMAGVQLSHEDQHKIQDMWKQLHRRRSVIVHCGTGGAS